MLKDPIIRYIIKTNPLHLLWILPTSFILCLHRIIYLTIYMTLFTIYKIATLNQ